MKKFFVLFILLFFPMLANAENIFDNYTINVSFKNNEIHILETFNVINANEDSDNFMKKTFANKDKFSLLQCNIIDYRIVDEEINNPYIVGTVETNKTYMIEYIISDYSEFGTHAFDFYSPFETTINDLNFRIEYDNNISSVGVYGYESGKYEIKHDNNVVTGILTEPSVDTYFTVDAYTEKNAYTENNNEENNYYSPFGNTNRLFFGIKEIQIISVICLIMSMVGLRLFKNRNSNFIIVFVFTILGLVMFQYVLLEPFLLAIAVFYGIFYSMFFMKNLDISLPLEIGIFLFIAFHSFFLLGLSTGIVPHVINNITIYVTSRIFRNYLSKR